MPLILGGGGSAEQEAANVDHLAKLLRSSERPLLYLPLAAEDPSDPRFDEWIHSVFAPRGVTQIEICRSVAQASSLDLGEFSGVFMGGGNTYLLMHRLRESGLDVGIGLAAADGLPVYGGSAGAIVLGADIESCAHLDENKIALSDTSGLDLCHGLAIWCHFDQPADRPRIEEWVRRRGRPILALAEESGALVDGPRLWSLGVVPVESWTANGPRVVERWPAV
jgi:dipeptidase E